MFNARFSLRTALILVSIAPILAMGCPPAPPAPTGPEAAFVVVRDPIDFTVEGEVPTEGETPATEKLELMPEDPLVGFDPQLVQFVDQSTPGTRAITIWQWNFGDGASSNEQNPVHTYDKTGFFTVSLTVANGLGTDRITKTDLIQVNERVGPQADFDYSPERGLDPLTVQFHDRSVAGVSKITAWTWDFGDGGSSTIQNPRHEFRSLGSFSVSLTATTAVGSDTFTKTAAVEVVPPLKAKFEPSVTSGKLPLSVSFNNTSDEGERTDVVWHWDFGDGAISSARNPAHVYNLPGVYTVSLTANNGARSDTLTRNALIEVLAPVPPVAQFAATPTTGNAPLTVLFRDRSTPGSASITSWEWYFGEGLKQAEGEVEGTLEGEPEGEGEGAPIGSEPDSTEQNPLHIYRTPGTYTVSLVVRSADGEALDTQVGYITVFNPVAAEFTADVTSGLAPLSVQFTDQSDIGGGPVTARVWNFGDGSSSNLTNPLHVYATPGTYDVLLSITTPEGTIVQNKAAFIEVIAPVLPVADFDADVTTGPAPLEIAFNNTSEPGTGADPAYTWDFGDSTTSAEENPLHIYERLGVYTVELEVGTSLGTSSETKVDYVRAETEVLSAGDDAADRFRGIQVAADGSFAVAGSTRSFGDGMSQIFFVRYAADGNVIAQAVYPSTGNARATDLVSAPDGGFVLTGEIETPEKGMDVLALKVDSKGNEVWRNAIGFAGNDRGNAVLRTVGGGYLIAGSTDHPGNQDVFLVRLDGEGNLLWTREIGGPSYDVANDVVAVSDGYWLTGASGNGPLGGGDVLLLRTDLTGNAALTRYFGGPFEDAGNALATTPDGNLVIGGVSGNADGATDETFVTYNPTLDSHTIQSYAAAGDNEILSLQSVPGDGYVLTGSTTSRGNELFDILLIRANQDGSLRWARTLGGSGSEIGFAVGVNTKGEFLVTGQSDSFGDGSLDGIVIKTNADGVQQRFPE